MREILFRGKKRDNSEWAYGDLLHLEHCVSIRSKNNAHSVIPETIGQYTGLTDKNGNKIFEGDIVNHNNKIYVIKYLEKYARFAPTNSHSVFMVCAFEHLEIIGNIHDNPELLKGE